MSRAKIKKLGSLLLKKMGSEKYFITLCFRVLVVEIEQ